MLRSVVACALVATVAGDAHKSNLDKKDDCMAVFAAITSPGCPDVVEMGRCFAREGISKLAATSAVRITAEHEMILAEEALLKQGIDCRTEDDHSVLTAPKLTADVNGDLLFDVHEQRDVEVHRYKREIVSLYQVTDQLRSLEDRCSDNATIAEDVSDAEKKLQIDVAAIEEDVATFEGQMGLEVRKMQNDIDDAVGRVDDLLTEKTSDLKTAFGEVEKDLKKDMDEAIEALEKQVKSSLADYQPAKKWANDTGNPAWRKNYDLVMVEVAPDNTENGHAGTVFYKVNFNPNTVAFFYPNRRELIRACAELSKDLKNQVCPNDKSKKDGLNRDLKPVCDHHRGDGNSVELSGSYLSHCGCGGYPRQRQCLGMSEYMLRGTVTYNRQNSWHGCHMLRHDRECHHHWVDCYSRSSVQADFTICAAKPGNMRKKGPLAGCA
jgi:hypothetical protein